MSIISAVDLDDLDLQLRGALNQVCDALTAWAKKRGLDLDEAQVEGWEQLVKRPGEDIQDLFRFCQGITERPGLRERLFRDILREPARIPEAIWIQRNPRSTTRVYPKLRATIERVMED